ncbi:MAG: substrate-binding domain-containing protein [Spirochaetaceae bacterium]|jgi:inositol transport system substrate-binding protein|nr:substrate-binding domain-containing protein [Spirochaetaceae bacterium]
MKKNVWVGMAALLALSALLGCSRQQGGGGKTRIGYICNNFNDTFQGYIMNEAKAFFADKSEYEVIFQDAQEDVIKQQDLASTLIAQGVKALIVVPVNTNATAPITSAAQEAKIPLVYVNRNPFGEGTLPANVYYVGSQEVIAGQMQMEAMGNLLGGSGGVAILIGKLDNEGALLRTEGNKDTIKRKFPGVSILAEETANWQRDQGLSLTENWLTAYGMDLKGILANNDEMALGAVEALKAAGRTDVLVMGVDAIPDAKAAVSDGSLAATVLQDAAGQGRGAAETAYKVLRGDVPQSITWVPFILITKENLAQHQ